MKENIHLSLVMLCILAAPLPLPLSARAEQEGRAPVAQEQEAHEKSMQERLGKLGAQLDQLKRDADARKKQAEATMKKNLEEAEKKRQVAARKLAELGKASKDSWAKFSAEADRAVKEFEQAFGRVIPNGE